MVCDSTAGKQHSKAMWNTEHNNPKLEMADPKLEMVVNHLKTENSPITGCIS